MLKIFRFACFLVIFVQVTRCADSDNPEDSSLDDDLEFSNEGNEKTGATTAIGEESDSELDYTTTDSNSTDELDTERTEAKNDEDVDYADEDPKIYDRLGTTNQRSILKEKIAKAGTGSVSLDSLAVAQIKEKYGHEDDALESNNSWKSSTIKTAADIKNTIHELGAKQNIASNRDSVLDWNTKTNNPNNYKYSGKKEVLYNNKSPYKHYSNIGTPISKTASANNAILTSAVQNLDPFSSFYNLRNTYNPLFPSYYSSEYQPTSSFAPQITPDTPQIYPDKKESYYQFFSSAETFNPVSYFPYNYNSGQEYESYANIWPSFQYSNPVKQNYRTRSRDNFFSCCETSFQKRVFRSVDENRNAMDDMQEYPDIFAGNEYPLVKTNERSGQRKCPAQGFKNADVKSRFIRQARLPMHLFRETHTLYPRILHPGAIKPRIIL